QAAAGGARVGFGGRETVLTHATRGSTCARVGRAAASLAARPVALVVALVAAFAVANEGI
ncbi:MAG TPA: hypothetical protein VJS30_12555, partial [Paraburkholderia sp.]|nr:hypothetical protein [Paraburkholderia sp.]